MNIKRRKIQIEPKTKLNYNIYIADSSRRSYFKTPQLHARVGWFFLTDFVHEGN